MPKLQDLMMAPGPQTNPYVKSLMEQHNDTYGGLLGQLGVLLGITGPAEQDMERIDDLRQFIKAIPAVGAMTAPVQSVHPTYGAIAGSWDPDTQQGGIQLRDDPYGMFRTIAHEGAHIQDLPRMETPTGLYSNEMDELNRLQAFNPRSFDDLFLNALQPQYFRSPAEVFARLVADRLSRQIGSQEYRSKDVRLGSFEKFLKQHQPVPNLIRFGQD